MGLCGTRFRLCSILCSFSNQTLNDYRGTASADRADGNFFEALEKFITKEEGECIVGFSLFLGEDYSDSPRNPQVHIYLYDGDLSLLNSENDPVPLRDEQIDITLEDFFNLFKRFHVLVSTSGCLDNRTVEGVVF